MTIPARREKTVADRQRALGRELDKLLPPEAINTYRDLCGGLFGETIDDVIRFALISFLHDRVANLGLYFRRDLPREKRS